MTSPKKANRFMLMILVIPIFAQIAIGFATVLLFGGRLPVSLVEFNIICQLITTILPIALYFIITKQKVSRVLPTRELGFVNIIIILAIIIFIQPLSMLLSGISGLLFPNAAESLLDTVVTTDPAGIILSFITVSAIPGIFEEIAMRGIVFRGYQNIPFKKAALINGLFFAIWHLHPQQFLYAFLLGFLFCYLVKLTKSIYSSILAHMTMNGIQLLMYFSSLAAEKTGEFSQTKALLETMSDREITLMAITQLMPICIISIPILLILLFLLAKINMSKNGNVFETIPEFPKSVIYTKSFWAIIAVYIIYCGLSLFLGLLPTTA